MVKKLLKLLTAATLLTGLTLVASAYYDPHWRYQYMFNEIKDLAGSNVDEVKLIIIPEDVLNAYTNGVDVYFYQGMIDFLEHNPDSIAYVMAHELAHIQLRHASFLSSCRSSPTMSRACERRADLLAEDILNRSTSYDICEGAEVWFRINRIFGSDYSNNASHPPSLSRFRYLTELCDDK